MYSLSYKCPPHSHKLEGISDNIVTREGKVNDGIHQVASGAKKTVINILADFYRI